MTVIQLAVLSDPRDNVAVALSALSAGTLVLVANIWIRLVQNVPYAHKFACRPLGNGEDVIRCGEVVGEAKAAIQAGELVGRHNLEQRVEKLRGSWRNDLVENPRILANAAPRTA
jgi:altronate dehydratase small subunit